MQYRQTETVLATLRHAKPCGTAVARLVRVRVEIADPIPDPTGKITEHGVEVHEQTRIEFCPDPKQAQGKGTRDRFGGRQRLKWDSLPTDQLARCELAFCDKCGKEFIPEDLLRRLENLVRVGRPKGNV